MWAPPRRNEFHEDSLHSIMSEQERSALKDQNLSPLNIKMPEFNVITNKGIYSFRIHWR
jgi:hypothetical protein